MPVDAPGARAPRRRPAAPDEPAVGQLHGRDADQGARRALRRRRGARRRARASCARSSSELGHRAAVVDGSGLSRSDRTSPRDVVALLDGDATATPSFTGSLRGGRAGPARSQDRMRGTAAQDRCRAKTGTLRDVSALAGYCTTRAGGQRRVRVPHELREPVRARGSCRTGWRSRSRATGPEPSSSASRPGLVEHRHAEPLGLLELRAGRLAGDDVVGLLDTDEVTRPPAARIRSVACSRVRSGSVPVSTSVRPLSTPSPGGAPSASKRTYGRRSSISARICASASWPWISSATTGPMPGVAAICSARRGQQRVDRAELLREVAAR